MADSISATPQNPYLAPLARGVRSLQELAGQYEVKPWVPLLGGTSVDELLGLPGAAREVENWSYGNAPFRINPYAGGTASYVPEVKPGRKSDLADTLLLAADVVPVMPAASRAVAGGANLLGDVAVRAITRNPTATAVGALREAGAMNPLSAIVKPVGNINLAPVTRAEMLKGPEVQPVENFLAQVRNTPGVTAEGFDELAKRYQGLEPGAKLSKTEFEQLVPPSEYSRVDLAGSAADANEHLYFEAADRISPSEIYESLAYQLGSNNPRRITSELDDFVNEALSWDQLSPETRELLQRNGVDEPYKLETLFLEERDNMIQQVADELYRESGGSAASRYPYFEYQRLVSNPEAAADNYFEMGVTHPELRDQPYRHYGDYYNRDDGLVGHVRGTYFGADDAEDARELLLGKTERGTPFTLTAKPRSLVIEEIQSDAQKGVKQSGALRQAHGTVFKAAIDNALERGARTVYLPTSEVIGMVRGKPGAAYASIYDQQVVKEGLKPLLKIPGVTVTDIPGDGSLAGKTAYRQIDFTDEAREYILNGPGQLAPGYALGGLVQKYDDGGAVKPESRWEQFKAAAAPEAPVAWLLEKLGQGVGNIKQAITDPRAFHERALGNLARRIQEDPEGFALDWTGGGLGGVIKGKGGNWLAGQVEKAVAPLKRQSGFLPGFQHDVVTLPDGRRLSQTTGEVLPPGEALTPDSAINKWLDQKLTKYIKNEMATPEDPLRLAAERWEQAVKPRMLAEKNAQLEKAKADLMKAQRERNVPEEYLTSSRARILELEKERDLINARTGLHFAPQPTQQSLMAFTKENRALSGFPREGMATTDLAKRWEDLADKYLEGSGQAGQMTKPGYWLRESDAQRITAENPWLFKVPPETPVYRPNAGVSQNETGFKHMVDELKNAMNPESGLPKELQISAKDLDKMNVAQVSELVDRINAHRAVQKAEANKLAAQKSIEVYKEYPDSPQGLRWVEMKQIEPKEFKLPEGYQMVEDPVRDQTGRAVQQGYRLYSPEGSPLSYGETPTQAYAKYFGKKDLEAALKYEGDVMQHCVGGYCPDVVEGRSRIFSLRDANGQPYATVEVKPDVKATNPDYAFELANSMIDRVPARQRDEFQQFLQDEWTGSDLKTLLSGTKWEKYIPEEALQSQTPMFKIEQIKGHGNKKPPEEMMPYIQDFVKSQKWSSVGDAGNAGLFRIDPKSDLARDLRAAQMDVPDYVTNDELTELFNAVRGKAAGGAVGMAHGGLVQGYAAGGPVEYDPERVSALAEQLLRPAQRYATGGAVSTPNDYDEGKIQSLADSILEEFTHA